MSLLLAVASEIRIKSVGVDLCSHFNNESAHLHEGEAHSVNSEKIGEM
jgi:hypothetical protein